MSYKGNLAITGDLATKKLSGGAPLVWKLKNNLQPKNIKLAVTKPIVLGLAKYAGIMAIYAQLEAIKIFKNGHRMNYGIVGRHSVTDAFVAFMVDQLQAETSVWGDFKFHDSGVGVTAENVTDTDIETTDGESRATGSQEEGASAWIYKSIGTIAYTTTKAITEHGLFSASTGVTLLDRTVFSAINVVNGDSIEFTYQITITAGG